MCGGSYAGRGGGRFMERDVEEMDAGARVLAALVVLGLVALSGVFLIVFVPQLWWIFTTYFWVAFPALGLLTSGVSGLGEARPARVYEAELERELLEAIRDGGEVSAASVAARTSLSVAEADRKLKGLAENGHIDVRARSGAVLYALWGADDGVKP
jgi:hypothetical protein